MSDEVSATTEHPDRPRSRLEAVLARSLLIVVVGSIGLGIAAALSFGWGIAKTYDFARLLFVDGADSDLAVVQVLELIDTFLLATVLLLAIKVLEKTITSKEPLDLVWYAISITLVGGLLIVFREWKHQAK